MSVVRVAVPVQFHFGGGGILSTSCSRPPSWDAQLTTPPLPQMYPSVIHRPAA
jgi:hypothetical protein